MHPKEKDSLVSKHPFDIVLTVYPYNRVNIVIIALRISCKIHEHFCCCCCCGDADKHGVPHKMEEIRLQRRILHQQLNSHDADFLDFIKRCFE